MIRAVLFLPPAPARATVGRLADAGTQLKDTTRDPSAKDTGVSFFHLVVESAPVRDAGSGIWISEPVVSDGGWSGRTRPVCRRRLTTPDPFVPFAE